MIGVEQSTSGSVSLQQTIDILSKDLYQISPVSKSVNRDILSLAYTPGVGEVCLQIQNYPEKADYLTFRGRAVAIVSDGSMLDSAGKNFMPVMDWAIAQLKYYSGVDAFAFVVRKQTNLQELFKDLSTSYGTILYLDGQVIKNIPQNILFIKQLQIAKYLNIELTDFSLTSSIIAYLISEKVKGFAKQEHFREGKGYKASNFINQPQFQSRLHDKRTLKQHAMQFHTFYKGKIMIELNFRDINQIKDNFSEKLLRQIVQKQNVLCKTRKVSAIVTDGTAILGLGNIGPMAGLPVMEGKSLLFKILGDVDVVPFCMYPRKTPQEEIKAINNSIGFFRAINLEDIKAPQCFEVERTLKKMNLQPIFHDDQHGTAIVVLAGLINALKVANKKIQDVKIIINGAGAAGATIARLILSYGAKNQNMIVCDSKGSIYKGRKDGMNEQKEQLADLSNSNKFNGSLQQAVKGSDVFIGVSAGNALKKQWVKTMNEKSIIFALANPNPQILPNDAKQGGAFIYASGRSDFQNQINNSLVFPGIFKGILKHSLSEITEQMKLMAAVAISNSLIKEANREYIIPDSLDRDVTIKIAQELGNVKK